MKQVQRRRVRAGVAQVDIRKYPNRLQLYRDPPLEEVTLEEFETFGFDRLKVLKAIEHARLTFAAKGKRLEYNNHVDTSCSKHLPLSEHRESSDVNQLYHERRKDHISHFVLRLAFCRTEDQRKWLLQQETELFRRRIDGVDLHEFIKHNGLSYEPVNDEERAQYARELAAAAFNMSEDDVRTMQYFKLPFAQALELIRHRKVYLRRGYAYVPKSELVTIVCGSFRAALSEALVHTAKALPHLEEDERLDPLLRFMSKTDLARDYTNENIDGVSIHQLDDLSRRSFPLCMRNLHENFRKNHHLKHWGRLQYGLFLKSIGISLDDALTLWRNEFSKAMPAEKFDKEHAYTLRHMYGKEGKRTNYSAYSCVKIITGNAPNSGDHHGCPFKHFDAANLRAKLRDWGARDPAIHEILGLVKDHHYQIACGKYYEQVHNLKAQESVAIEHPTQYFKVSMAHYDEKKQASQPSQPSQGQGSQHASQTPQPTGAADTPLYANEGTPMRPKPANEATATGPADAGMHMELD